MSAVRTRFRFSVDDYEQMLEFGILGENDRVELIRGEIVEKISIGELPAASVKKINAILALLLQGRAIVGIQDPIRLADSMPEPDISVQRLRSDYYASAHPTPADVLLLIEVADSTLEYDRTVKLSLYAEAGIAEYWIVNLVDSCIEVHRKPRPDGQYDEVQRFDRGQSVTVPGFSDCVLAVDQAL